MTPTPLTGFIIHSRPYQEKRAIYQLFSLECGLIDGVGSRGLPLFAVMSVQATGKNSLKTLTSPHFLTATAFAPLPPDLQCPALYLNELLYNLLPKDDPHPALWHCYHQTLTLFGIGCDDLTLRCALRRFEWGLFGVLGVPIVFDCDSQNRAIELCQYYRYDGENGLVKLDYEQDNALIGNDIFKMHTLCQTLQNDLDKIDFATIDRGVLALLGHFFRQRIDELLNFKPLHSRKLWQERLKWTNNFCTMGQTA